MKLSYIIYFILFAIIRPIHLMGPHSLRKEVAQAIPNPVSQCLFLESDQF